MTAILAILPKQRHIGLFSVTEAKNMEEILKFGLRNPIRLNVSSDKSQVLNPEEEKTQQAYTGTILEKEVGPKELTNYYTVDKLKRSRLDSEILGSRRRSKIVGFGRIFKGRMAKIENFAFHLFSCFSRIFC